MGAAWPKEKLIRFLWHSGSPSPILPQFLIPVMHLQCDGNSLLLLARWQHYNAKDITETSCL